MKRYIQQLTLALSLFTIHYSLSAQTADQLFKAAGSPVNPKVAVSWNRYNDHAAITEICKKIAAAYPDLAKLESIGKSYKGRDIWCLTVTDYKKGSPDKKPGMYVDGNIHSNEVQGAEFSLYTAWYLTESFNDTKFVQELLADKVFYIVPTINPDGRDSYFHEPNTASSPRSGVIPVDNDRDGLVDEDGYDDLDNDKEILTMRRKNPNGRLRVDPTDPRRMIQVGPDEKGEYEILGQEGKDNDGDGQVNEDGYTFEYDPNRDWGWGWQPNYIQNAVLKYAIAQDAGFAINPLSVEGQMQGGVSQGIGLALWEEMLYDDQGRLLNGNLLDYRLPTTRDLPNIETIIVEVPSEEGPFGARIIGEPSIVAGLAVIDNAIADATGVWLSESPFTPERVLRATGKL